MNQNDINKSFVSQYDKFLLEFDADHAKTDSQLKEIKKHQAIFALRDGKDSPENLLPMEGF
jgi:hypothetical protein